MRVSLLQRIIDIEPGRPGAFPSVQRMPDGAALAGSTILQIENDSPNENAFTIRFSWNHDYLLVKDLNRYDPLSLWMEMISLAPPTLPGAASSQKRDEYGGPNDYYLKIYVPRQGKREVTLRFDTQKHPSTRAGRYPFTVEITQEYTAPQQGGSRESKKVVEGLAIIRPYYDWTLDVTPEKQYAGMRRRSAEFDVEVVNQSNDWLYCDIQLPPNPNDFYLESRADPKLKTLRVAVPPPDPLLLSSPEKTARRIPVRITTRLRKLAGPQMPQKIEINAVRWDAPSAAILTPNELLNNQVVTFSRSVTAKQQPSDKRNNPPERALMYCPPIPGTVTDFFDAIRRNIWGCIAFVIGFIILFNLVLIIWNKDVKKRIPHKDSSTETQSQSGSSVSNTESQLTSLPSGVKFRDEELGEGASAADGNRVKFDIDIRLEENGKIIIHNPNLSFNLGAHGDKMQGLNDGMRGMKPGGRRFVVIPPEQGYGSERRGPIPPNATLYTTIALKQIH